LWILNADLIKRPLLLKAALKIVTFQVMAHSHVMLYSKAGVI
jgi:hypothetical protein